MVLRPGIQGFNDTVWSVLYLLIAIWPHARWVAYINIPYLAWVSFATVLQLTITFINK